MKAPRLPKAVTIILPPDGPYIDASGVLLEAGKELMVVCLMNGETADLVADRLGLTPSEFEKRIGKTGTPWSNAWRVAEAKAFAPVMAAIRRAALEGDNTAQLQFVSRVSGVSEKSALAEKTEAAPHEYGDAGRGNLVTIPFGLSPSTAALVKAELAAAGKFSLPGPMSDEAYNAQRKTEHVHDARSDEAKKRHAEAFPTAVNPDDDGLPPLVNPDDDGRDLAFTRPTPDAVPQTREQENAQQTAAAIYDAAAMTNPRNRLT